MFKKCNLKGACSALTFERQLLSYSEHLSCAPFLQRSHVADHIQPKALTVKGLQRNETLMEVITSFKDT